MFETGKIKWIREESLSDIVAIEMIDLPLADTGGAIEKQINNANGKILIISIVFILLSIPQQMNDFYIFAGDIIGNFIHRISTQLNQIKHFIRTVFDVVSTHHIPTKSELTRDAFGLHTIIVVVTSSGKVNTSNIQRKSIV